MVEIIAKEGFEDIFAILNQKISAIEEEKQEELNKLSAEIDARFESKLAEYKEVLKSISTEVEVEEKLESVEVVEVNED